MVTPNTSCWIDVRDSGLFAGRTLGEDLAASLFVNESLHLVVANFRRTATVVTTADAWTDRRTGESGTTWDLAPRTLQFLSRVAPGEA